MSDSNAITPNPQKSIRTWDDLYREATPYGIPDDVDHDKERPYKYAMFQLARKLLGCKEGREAIGRVWERNDYPTDSEKRFISGQIDAWSKIHFKATLDQASADAIKAVGANPKKRIEFYKAFIKSMWSIQSPAAFYERTFDMAAQSAELAYHGKITDKRAQALEERLEPSTNQFRMFLYLISAMSRAYSDRRFPVLQSKAADFLLVSQMSVSKYLTICRNEGVLCLVTEASAHHRAATWCLEPDLHDKRIG